MTCPDCGNPVEGCSDPERPWFPWRRVCYATMEREAADAMYAALHEDVPFHDGTFTSWAKDRSHKHPYRFSEGVTIGVASTDLAPHDLFTTEKNASPVPPGSADGVTLAQQAVGDAGETHDAEDQGADDAHEQQEAPDRSSGGDAEEQRH